MKRATYTCIGDAVNLAARLEAHTKDARCSILADGATRAALPPGTSARALGAVAIRGKAEPVEVFVLDVEHAGDPPTRPGG